jgi:hypothetical protein
MTVRRRCPATAAGAAENLMKKNPLNQGVLTENFVGIGPATRAMARARAAELSAIAGRGPAEVTQADYERAKRELTGESDIDRQDALLDALPESKRWDSIPGSEGREVPETPSEDEDDEGRSETEQLVEEGAMEAERDRMLQAARAAEKTK